MSKLKNVKVALVSLGCDKNRVDSEVMLGALAGAACVFTPDLAGADAIIINTCGFLGDAVDEAKEAMQQAIEQKKTGPCRAIVVTGCAAQRYKQEIFDNMAEIDAILGVNEYDRITQVLQQALEGRRYADFDDANVDGEESRRTTRVLSTPAHYAYLKIAEGCDKACTYCTIPKIRGRYKSWTMESLLEEAQILARGGVKELVLVAQDTTLYGCDIYGRQVLHELLRRLSKIDGLHWLRLLYCYPEHIYDGLLNEMASNPKVLPYVDMPIQHASDKILRLMGRQSSSEQLRGVISKLRRAIPHVALRTTLIAGFPGETKEDFKALCDFIREARFDRLGVFAYSAEEGTGASKLPDQIISKTKEARKNRLMAIQQEVSISKLAEKVGHTMEVIVEGFDDAAGLYFGRSTADAPEIDGLVYINSPGGLEIGSFVMVSITEAAEYDLLGVLT